MSMLSLRDIAQEAVRRVAARNDLVEIVTGLFMPVSIFLLVLRGVSRWPWKEKGSKEDIVAIVATVVSIIQGAITIKAASSGLGKNPDDFHGSRAYCTKLIYVSNLIFIITMFISRLSTILSLARISNMKSRQQRLLIWGMQGLCGIFFVASFVVVAAQPGAPTPGLKLSRFATKYMIGSWSAYTAVSSLLDAAICVYPMWLVWGLQMSQYSKCMVVASFAVRAGLIVISALRVQSVAMSARSDKYLYDYTWTAIWTQSEILFAQIAVTIPSFRVYMLMTESGILDMERVTSWTDPAPQQAAAVPMRAQAPVRRDLGEPAQGTTSFTSVIGPSRDFDESSIVDYSEPGRIGVRQKVEVSRSKPPAPAPADPQPDPSTGSSSAPPQTSD